MVNDEQHYSHKMRFVLHWLSAPGSILYQVKFIFSVGSEIRGWLVKFFQEDGTLAFDSMLNICLV